MSEHESWLDCELPDTAENGEKHTCDCGRVWRYDNRYFHLDSVEADA